MVPVHGTLRLSSGGDTWAIKKGHRYYPPIAAHYSSHLAGGPHEGAAYIDVGYESIADSVDDHSTHRLLPETLLMYSWYQRPLGVEH